jgi:midasin
MALVQVSFPNGKLAMGRWIDQFPFPFYLVVRELKALPQVLSDALRQWFEMLKE